jgi:hypothetical protein
VDVFVVVVVVVVEEESAAAAAAAAAVLIPLIETVAVGRTNKFCFVEFVKSVISSFLLTRIDRFNDARIRRTVN